MAEVNTAEKEAKAEAAFGAGFGDTPPAEVVKVVEEATPESAKADVIAEAAVPVPEKTQYVRLTKQELDQIKARAGKVDSLESRVAKFEGAIPKEEQLVQRAIEAFRAQTPSGGKVTVTAEDFAELGENFEEVSGMTMKGLQRVLDRFNVTGTAAAPDPAALEQAVEATLKKREDAAVAKKRGEEFDGLLKIYPNWGEIVGRPAKPGGEVEQTDWRKWATTNDHAALETDSPAVVQASIAKFMESQKKPASAAPPVDKAAARRAVIADAQTPRAEGGAPPLNAPPSADEAFSSGFKAVRRVA